MKREILNYFSVIDIQGYVGYGKKMFELKQSVGGVTAIIRIPIKNNKYIQYSRSYIENKFQDRIQQADEDNNLGIIIENQFAIAIYPFLKHPSEVKPHYRVMLADRDVQALNKHYTYKLSFFLNRYA